MFKLVDADIDGMMSRAEYIVIVGLLCLCLFVAPAMAESKVCSKCVPEVKPAFGSDCPVPCVFELGENFWDSVGAGGGFDENGFITSDLLIVSAKDLLDATPLLPGDSKFGTTSYSNFAIPELNDSPKIDLTDSKWGNGNPMDDMKSEFIKFKPGSILKYTGA